MKIIYIPGKPIKRITCPTCFADHITGDELKVNRALEWKDLHDQGQSYRTIAKQYGLTHDVVRLNVKKVS